MRGVGGRREGASVAAAWERGASGRAIDLEGMVKEVPSARERYEDEVAQAKRFVELLGVGSWDIRSKTPEGGYNLQKENRNWFFAIGGYSSWGVGRAVVSGSGPGSALELDFAYRFYDRYN